MPGLTASGRRDLGARERAVLAPLLPAPSGRGRPGKHSLLNLVNGIRWRIRTGAPWRDVPENCGPWQPACGLFRKWQLDGTRAGIVLALQALADAAGYVTWDVWVDSGTAWARRHAAGVRKDGVGQEEPPGPEPGDRGLGRSRGGLTARFRLAVEQSHKPLAVIVTAGQRGDSPQFIPVLDKIHVPRLHGGRPRTRPDRVLAGKARVTRQRDKGCDSAAYDVLRREKSAVFQREIGSRRHD